MLLLYSIFLSYLGKSSQPVFVSNAAHTRVHQRHNLLFLKMAQKNVPHGKKTRGLTVVATYVAFKGSRDREALRHACIVGWAIEWVSFLLGFVMIVISYSL